MGAQGLDFTRSIIALALAKGDRSYAATIAAQRWGAGSRAATVTKAAVPGGGTTGWGGELTQTAAAEFFSVVAERSIPGRLTNLRRMPLATRVVAMTGGATAHWVGEGAPKPITSAAFSATTLAALKVVAVSVVTRELLESSDPAAEGTIRADLLRAVLAALDIAFVDPTNAGVADVSPASITNGVTPIPSTGTAGGDVRALVAVFSGDLDAAFLVLAPELGVGAAGAEHPRIGARGGDIAGIPALTSRHVPAGVVALLDPGGIAYGEGDAEARVAMEGTVEMADEPTGSGSLVSLWQTGAVGLLAGRAVNWQRIRPGSVAVVTGASYGATPYDHAARHP